MEDIGHLFDEATSVPFAEEFHACDGTVLFKHLGERFVLVFTGTEMFFKGFVGGGIGTGMTDDEPLIVPLTGTGVALSGGKKTDVVPTVTETGGPVLCIVVSLVGLEGSGLGGVLNDGRVEGSDEIFPRDASPVGVGVGDFFDDSPGEEVGIKGVGDERGVGVPNGHRTRGWAHPIDAVVGQRGVLSDGVPTSEAETVDGVAIVLVGFVHGKGAFVGVDDFLHLPT